MHEFVKQYMKIILWIIGGMTMGHSFACPNSFSAELYFSLGLIIAVLGFYV